MSIAGLLFRFATIYVAALVIVAVVLTALGVGGSQTNFIALFGATIGALSWFGRRNRRALQGREFWQAVLGMWAVDMTLQLLVTVAALSGALSSARGSMAVWMLVVLFGTIGLMHGIGIALTTWFLNRSFAKTYAKEMQAVFE